MSQVGASVSARELALKKASLIDGTLKMVAMTCFRLCHYIASHEYRLNNYCLRDFFFLVRGKRIGALNLDNTYCLNVGCTMRHF